MKIMGKQRTWLAVLCFVIVLTGFRFAWLYAYNPSDASKADKGIIDVSKTDLSKRPIHLGGEWGFYPEQLLSPDSLSLEKAKWVRVPSDWREWIQNNQGDPYGYGTFHLRILTGSDKTETYRIRFMGIRSASRVFVNGRMVEEMGSVGTEKLSTVPKKAPFSVNARAVDGKIDLVVQVSNFHNLESGGISSFVYFGTRETVKQHEQTTMAMQLIASAVLFFEIIGTTSVQQNFPAVSIVYNYLYW